MKKIVVDTDILIDYANGFAQWLTDAIKTKSTSTQLVLPTIVIAEYFTSTTLESEYEAKVADETFSYFEKQDLTEGIAKVLGTILRRKTYAPGAGLADLIIAATTICLGGKLATRNKQHFREIPGLHFFEEESEDKRLSRQKLVREN